MGWHCILQFTIYDIDNIFNKMQVVSPNFRLIPFGTWITVLFLDILYLAIKIMLFYVLMSYLHYLCLLVYSGVQHVLYCVSWFICLRPVSCVWWHPTRIVLCFFASFVFVLCLVYDGIQHVLYCVSWFICFRLMSCVPNIASFSGLSILDCPFGSSNNILPIKNYGKLCSVIRE